MNEPMDHHSATGVEKRVRLIKNENTAAQCHRVGDLRDPQLRSRDVQRVLL